MKEIQQQIKPLTEKVIAAEQRNKSEVFIGEFRIKPGQQMFKLDNKTGVISILDDSDYKVVLKKGKFNDMVPKKQLHIKGLRYKYIIALNKKNAYKKFKRKGFNVKPISKAFKNTISAKDKDWNKADIIK